MEGFPGALRQAWLIPFQTNQPKSHTGLSGNCIWVVQVRLIAFTNDQ